jgi:hypothetical protein
MIQMATIQLRLCQPLLRRQTTPLLRMALHDQRNHLTMLRCMEWVILLLFPWFLVKLTWMTTGVIYVIFLQMYGPSLIIQKEYFVKKIYFKAIPN